MTTTDYLKRLAESDLDDMVEKMVRAYDASRTPSDLRAKFQAFAAEQAAHIRRLDATVLAALSWWLIKGEEAGHDRDVLDQVALQSTHRAIAIIARAMKERQGQPFDPARVAIVAYAVAEGVAKTDGFKADLQGVTDEVDEMDQSFSGEVRRLRNIIDEIADMTPRDPEQELLELIVRCQKEQERWTKAEDPAP